MFTPAASVTARPPLSMGSAQHYRRFPERCACLLLASPCLPAARSHLSDAPGTPAVTRRVIGARCAHVCACRTGTFRGLLREGSGSRKQGEGRPGRPPAMETLHRWVGRCAPVSDSPQDPARDSAPISLLALTGPPCNVCVCTGANKFMRRARCPRAARVRR